MSTIVGIDEVGRGAFAGPLMAASVFLTSIQKKKLIGSGLVIRDSKTLSELQRERVYEALRILNIDFSVETVFVPDINEKGIGWANTTAIRRLIEKAQGPTESDSVRPLKLQRRCIVDGRFPMRQIAVEGIDVQCVVDADATILPVILAGIVAKVIRDRIMKELHEEFSYYKWHENKGYGTKYHIEAIKKYGMCEHHRRMFVQTALGKGLGNFIT